MAEIPGRADRSGALVSILVPVHNGERHLAESLDSILGQTYAPVEIIVLEDASTDGTAAVLEPYRDLVRVVRQPCNRGQFANVNDGLALARGSFIAVFHHDDMYHPTIVERLVDFLAANPGMGAAFCLDELMSHDGRVYGRVELPPDVAGGRPLGFEEVINALLRYKNRFLRTPGTIVRAEAYTEVGPYREDLGSGADLDMWLRIAQRRPIGILSEHLFRYRHSSSSVGATYYHLRTDPDVFFRAVDAALERGGRDVAAPDAWRDYEAHRAEDGIMVAVNAYIRGDRAAARAALGAVRTSVLVRSPRVQWGRLSVLLWAMRLLTRVPRLRIVADAFYRRWHHRSAYGPPATT